MRRELWLTNPLDYCLPHVGLYVVRALVPTLGASSPSAQLLPRWPHTGEAHVSVRPTRGPRCDIAKRAYGPALRVTRQSPPGNTGLLRPWFVCPLAFNPL